MRATTDRSRFLRARAPMALALALPILLTACGGSTATGSAGASGSPAPGQESALPGVSGSALPSDAPTSSLPAVGSLYLRMWFVNPSVGPENFHFSSTVISDSRLYYAGELAGGDPSSLLYVNPRSAAVTPAGLARVVAEARQDGLLGDKHVFNCPEQADGGVAGSGTTYLTIVVDGVTHELSGGCAGLHETPAPGHINPGTYDAFADFVAKLNNMIGWLGSDLATPADWVPPRLAVMAISLDSSESPDVDMSETADWRVGKFSDWGKPDDPTWRCGVLTGSNLAIMQPTLSQANESTVYMDSTGERRSLWVHPLMPNEPPPDSCA